MIIVTDGDVVSDRTTIILTLWWLSPLRTAVVASVGVVVIITVVATDHRSRHHAVVGVGEFGRRIRHSRGDEKSRLVVLAFYPHTGYPTKSVPETDSEPVINFLLS